MENIKKLGLIAGGGSLPLDILNACKDEKRPVHIIVFKGQPQPENLPKCPHIQVDEVGLASVGKVIKLLKKSGVEDVVLGGYLSKPSIFDLKPDLKGLSIFKRAKSMHDNAILTAVCDVLEEEGFTVKGAHEVCPKLLAEKGVWTKKKPSESQLESMRIGMKGARAIGFLDVGQAAIVKDGMVLGFEGVEGTAKLIERCSDLRGKSAKGGFLVKSAKPEQDLRVDMPSIGPKTVESLAKLKYEGLAVSAGETLVLEKEETIRLANKHGLILCGVTEEGLLEND